MVEAMMHPNSPSGPTLSPCLIPSPWENDASRLWPATVKCDSNGSRLEAQPKVKSAKIDGKTIFLRGVEIYHWYNNIIYI